MPQVPAQCPNPDCLAIFPSGFDLGNSRNITFRGDMSKCPLCGTMAPVAEGVFNASSEAIEVIVGSRITRDMIRQFQDVARAAASGAISKDEAVSQATAISPRLGRTLGGIMMFGLPGAALLLTIVGLYLQRLDSGEAHNDAVAQRVVSERILDELMMGQHTSATPRRPPQFLLPGLGGPPYRPQKT